jgi:hypothetical protein
LSTRRLIAILTAAILAVPTAAAAAGPPGDNGNATHGKSHRPATTNGAPKNGATTNGDKPGPDAPAAKKARAYGRYCQDLSKKHVDGEKGTPFSQCVTAMAKLATGKTTNPARACAHMSRKHAAGRSGTPYSKCVTAAEKLGDKEDGS